MARIVRLSFEELEQLRTRLLSAYRQKTGKEAFPNATTYLGTYEDLHEEIVSVINEAGASVSPSRLRKLFYYTDPAMWLPRHTDVPTFGKDFLQALEIYFDAVDRYKNQLLEAEIPVKQREPPKPGTDDSEFHTTVQPLPVLTVPGARRSPRFFTRRIFIITLPLLLALTGLLPLLWKSYSPSVLEDEYKSTWIEHFDSVQSGKLSSAGWQIIDYDSVHWSKQLKTGYLTAYTLAGGYWVKNFEQKKIRNLIVKRINGDCFTILVKVDDFNPYQNSQAAEIFLFDDSLSRDNYMEAAIFYWRGNTAPTGRIQFGFNVEENGQVVANIVRPLKYFLREAEREHLDSFWVRIHYENGNFTVAGKLNLEWTAYIDVDVPRRLHFKPAFVGLAAAHGWSEMNNVRKNADSIPVYFDAVSFKSCNH